MAAQCFTFKPAGISTRTTKELFTLSTRYRLSQIPEFADRSAARCGAKYRRYKDIGGNLVDGMYSGLYNGTKKHEPDLEFVLKRSWDAGLEKIIITGTSLAESKKAVTVANQDDRLFATVGCHPTNCGEIQSDDYLASLVELCHQNKEKIAAVGEFGLDYDRLHFCSKETQLKYFEMQLKYFSEVKLPLFLHCRGAADDLLSILNKQREDWTSGVVHSFDGSQEEARQFLDLGLYIGINGCSLKTEENLTVLQSIPSDRLLFETDCPWCEVRPSHAGAKYIKTKFPAVKKEKWEAEKMVKGRNEPATIVQILEIAAAVRKEDPQQLCDDIWKNSNNLFFKNK